MYSERIANDLSRVLGPLFVVMSLAWLSLVPAALAAVAARSWCHEPRMKGAGFVLGLAVGAWASTAWLCIPYLGVYPNIPGALLAAPFFQNGTPGQEWVVHLFNVTAWPLLGTALFRNRSCRAAPPVDPANGG